MLGFSPSTYRVNIIIPRNLKGDYHGSQVIDIAVNTTIWPSHEYTNDVSMAGMHLCTRSVSLQCWGEDG